MRATEPAPCGPFKDPEKRVLDGLDPRVEISVCKNDFGVGI